MVPLSKTVQGRPSVLFAGYAAAVHSLHASQAYAGNLPSWFYLIWSSANLTPLRREPKPGRTAAETPPRPIAVGEASQRALTAALTKAGMDNYRNHLLPQQLAIGVSDAAGQLVHDPTTSFSCLTHKTHFRLCEAPSPLSACQRSPASKRKLDTRKAQRTTSDLSGLSYIFIGPPPLRDRFFGDDDTRGDSEEGVMQGAPDSPAVYCVATHDELVSLDTAVAAEGGVARAHMNDVAVINNSHTTDRLPSHRSVHQRHLQHHRRTHQEGRSIRTISRRLDSRSVCSPHSRNDHMRRRVCDWQPIHP